MVNILIDGEKSTFLYDGLAKRTQEQVQEDLKKYNSANGRFVDMVIRSISDYNPRSQDYESLARKMAWGDRPDVVIWAPNPMTVNGDLFWELDNVKVDPLKILVYDSSRGNIPRSSGREDAIFDLQNPNGGIVDYIIRELKQ